MPIENDMLERFMSLPYTILVQVDDEGDYVARIAELQGCITHGSTIEEAASRLREVQKAWIAMDLEAGRTPPAPIPPDVTNHLPQAERDCQARIKAVAAPLQERLIAMEPIAERCSFLEGELVVARYLLWLRHGCSALYGDDGKMDCNKCLIDFKNSSMQDIQAQFQRISRRALAAHEAMVQKTKHWIIYFEDADKAPEVFTGEGSGEAARVRFAECQLAWTCHLFASVYDVPMETANALTDEQLAALPNNPDTHADLLVRGKVTANQIRRLHGLADVPAGDARR